MKDLKAAAPVRHTKESLSALFQSEEQIGVFYGHSQTKESLEDYKGDPELFEEIAWLPSGEYMGRCTHCAKFAVKLIGEGEVYGFMVKDNPVAHQGITDCFGHDFAVIQNRYIVDIWMSLYAGDEPQSVYDLRDKRDFAKITEIYGKPELWGMYSKEARQYLYGDELPLDKRPRLHRPDAGMSLSM
ncbi:hypothetical protein YA0089_24945 [Pseudomonas viridiflava]|uniref:hypothetical protein n=1 Tax=Pseudomonas viridiflava TaxID=33069 RepID=UPI0018E5D31A|nr:hypothetical protein [Pseudomonas viridiflava]MBI6726863.1 hypothetical protein [Pseudomonas viridiflava]